MFYSLIKTSYPYFRLHKIAVGRCNMVKEDNNKKISAQIDFSNSITLEGITGIVSSSDRSFTAKAGEGVLTVTGEGLSPRLIDIEKNTAILNGRIYAVSHSKQISAKGFFSKLFR